MAVLGGGNRRRGGTVLTLNELIFTFGGFYVCANFGENRSRNVTARVHMNGQTNRFYNLSHAICYSYGAGNYFEPTCYYVCSNNWYFIVFLQKASDDFEIAIVGAGPAGATCGYFLGMLMSLSIPWSFTVNFFLAYLLEWSSNAL